MKVLCIIGLKAGFVSMNTGEIASVKTEIYEGEIYTAINTLTIAGSEGYILEERSPRWLYACRRFIPLSSIDETELIKERQEYESSKI